MKTNEIIGKKIIDKNVKEVGKIAEMTFDKKTFKLTGIYASTGNPISKKYHDIKPENIMAIGDYLQTSTLKDELIEDSLDKIPKSDDSDIKSSEIIGKKVLDCNGNDSGKVSAVNIDIENQEITSLTVSKAATFSKATECEIKQNEITGFGDYILINKTLDFDVEEKYESEEESDSEEEKVNINVE